MVYNMNTFANSHLFFLNYTVLLQYGFTNREFIITIIIIILKIRTLLVQYIFDSNW